MSGVGEALSGLGRALELSEIEFKPPIHPGEILVEEFLKPHGLKVRDLVHRLGISDDAYRMDLLTRVCERRCALDIDMAKSLAAWFGTTVQFWTNMQMAYDKATAAERAPKD